MNAQWRKLTPPFGDTTKGEFTHRKRVYTWVIWPNSGSRPLMGLDLAACANVHEIRIPMNPEQLDALTLAVTVVSYGPSGVYSAEVLERLRRASGLRQHYGRECAQAVLVDAIARRGFFAVKRTRRSKAGA
jgi:hypothetical protein